MDGNCTNNNNGNNYTATAAAAASIKSGRFDCKRFPPLFPISLPTTTASTHRCTHARTVKKAAFMLFTMFTKLAARVFSRHSHLCPLFLRRAEQPSAYVLTISTLMYFPMSVYKAEAHERRLRQQEWAGEKSVSPSFDKDWMCRR